jgi:hypothetical protein
MHESENMFKHETSLNTTPKPVLFLKQNFSHMQNCCKIVTKTEKKLFSLVGELLEVYDDENEMVEPLVMIHKHHMLCPRKTDLSVASPKSYKRFQSSSLTLLGFA